MVYSPDVSQEDGESAGEFLYLELYTCVHDSEIISLQKKWGWVAPAPPYLLEIVSGSNEDGCQDLGDVHVENMEYHNPQHIEVEHCDDKQDN